MSRLTPFAAATAAALFSVAVVAAPPSPTPGNVFRAGETATIPLDFIHKDGKGLAITASSAAKSKWLVIDIDGVTLAEGESQGDLLSLPHAALGGRLGAFILSVVSGEGGSVTNETRFAFIPSGEVKPCKWVGTQFHYSRDTWGKGDERLLDLVAAAGIGIVRDEPYWSACEKEPGKYAMHPIIGQLVDGLCARGLDFCCILCYSNPKAYPENPLDANAFARWSAWCADYLKGRCDTFEIWNEPHNFHFWQQYGPLEGCTDRRDPRWIRHFTDFSRTVDDALAGRGLRVCVGAEDWPELLHTMLEQGIARPHNIVTIHPYDHTQPLPERAKWFRDGFADLRRRIEKSHPEAHEGKAKVAITEVGWTTFDATRNPTHDFVGFYPPVTYQNQARYLVRMYLMARQFGAEFVCQYDFKDDGLKANHTEHNFGLLDYWGHPKPSYAAIAAMTRLVGHAEPEGLLDGVDPAVARIYRFRREDGATVLAAWAVEGEMDVELGLRASALKQGAAFDLYGNRIEPPVKGGKLHLTGQPVYLVVSS